MRLSRTLFFVPCATLIAVGVTVATACITAPLPDLPQVPLHGPTIIHDAVQPPPQDVITRLAGLEFAVPVQVDEANAPFAYAIFVDYILGSNQSPVDFVDTDESPADGGPFLVEFRLDNAADSTSCHVITFIVAHGFQPNSQYTWDSLGGDLVSWFYNPGGSPGGCPAYDAGSLQDGAFPEAGADGLPVVPEAGDEP